MWRYWGESKLTDKYGEYERWQKYISTGVGHGHRKLEQFQYGRGEH